MSENKWARFLHTWGAKDLGTATSLVNAHVFADLDSEERALLQVLRKYHDVLLLKQDDSLQMYQTRLRSLYKLHPTRGIRRLPVADGRCRISHHVYI